MTRRVFPEHGLWLRGNLHCHSNRSDGHQPIEQLVASYEQAGYDFLAVSDHFEADYGWSVVDPDPAWSSKLTLLRAAELSSGPWEDPDVHWITAVGVPADLAEPPVGDATAPIRQAHAAGAYNVLLHPRLGDVPLNRLVALPWLHAVEVYTHTLATSWPDLADATATADALHRAGHLLHLNSGDDAHGDHPRDRFGGWIHLRAKDRSPDAILAALHAGHHYATQGPQIRGVVQRNDRLEISTSPVVACALTGPHSRWSPSMLCYGDERTEVVIDVPPHLPWIRITLADADGRRAWSNPITIAAD